MVSEVSTSWVMVFPVSGLDIVDGVGSLNLKGDGLSGQSLDKQIERCVEW